MTFCKPAQGLKDPEEKRKAIGAEFINVFQSFADKFEKEHGITPRYLVQVRTFSQSLAFFRISMTAVLALLAPCSPHFLLHAGRSRL